MATTFLKQPVLHCTRSYTSARRSIECVALLGQTRRLRTRTSTLSANAHGRRHHPQAGHSPPIHRSLSTQSSPSSSSSSSSPTLVSLYTGPLTRTYRTLKLFSLSSLALSSSLTPFMFLIESSLPFGARVALAVTAVTTSGVSTMLVGWAGSGYVVGIEGVRESANVAEKEGFDAIRIETRSLMLQPRFTTVYDPAFLGDTRRPLAKWELVERVDAPGSGSSAGSNAGTQEETVAETVDKNGKVLGRWIVQWSEDGKTGVCRGSGSVQRYFQVHDELLPASLRSIA